MKLSRIQRLPLRVQSSNTCASEDFCLPGPGFNQDRVNAVSLRHMKDIQDRLFEALNLNPLNRSVQCHWQDEATQWFGESRGEESALKWQVRRGFIGDEAVSKARSIQEKALGWIRGEADVDPTQSLRVIQGYHLGGAEPEQFRKDLRQASNTVWLRVTMDAGARLTGVMMGLVRPIEAGTVQWNDRAVTWTGFYSKGSALTPAEHNQFEALTIPNRLLIYPDEVKARFTVTEAQALHAVGLGDQLSMIPTSNVIQ